MTRAVLFAACLALSSCAPARRVDRKVIVLGIDAMDPNFLERHWDALPNLNRLRLSGDFQRLATTIPPQSPVAWSTFITGLDPGGTGIFDFVSRDPKTMELLSSMADVEPPRHTLSIGPYLIPLSAGHVRRFLRGKAFWQLLDEAGVPVTLLRMPNNFPPLPSRSRTLSGMGTPDMRGTFGTFSYYTDDALETAREVAGGRIVPVRMQDNRAVLAIEGPDNSLRKDHAPSSVSMTVTRDPSHPVALFEVDGQRFILQQGEWSDWNRVKFSILPRPWGAAGMFRVFAKSLSPGLAIYVSPVNIDPSAPELPISTPASYSRELADAIGPFYTQGIAEDTEALRAGVLTREEYHQQTRIVADEQFRMLHYALDHFTGGLLFLHFLGVDQDSHVSWGLHDDELLRTYQRVDDQVGRVMREAPDATLMVMSDHGFGSFNRAVNLNTWLWREGYLALDGASHIDWRHTRAYGLGLNSLYLNVAGRERWGIVPAADRDQLADEIARRLESLRDPLNGNLAVARVYRARDVYRASDDADAAPDLIVGWADGYRTSWQSALGEVAPEVIEDNLDEWRGDHCIAAELVPGVFLSNRKSRLADARLEDVTVTLLAQFGARPVAAMRGRAIF